MEENPHMGAGEDSRQRVLWKVHRVRSARAGECSDGGEQPRPPGHL